MTDRETLAVYDAKIDDYRKVFTSHKSRHLTQFIDAMPPGGRVLDLGCGPGNAAAVMAQAGLQTDAWDASAAMAKAAACFDGVNAAQRDFDALPDEPTYHGIYANFSLLHATRDDGMRHMRTIHTALYPGGVFHIGMKVGTGSKRDVLGRFYTYYTVPELRGFLTDLGFDITWEKQGEEPGLAGPVEPFVLMQGCKPNA